LDPFVKNLPVGNSDGDLQLFTELSLSKVDVKVLLITASLWSKQKTVSMEKQLPKLGFAFPSAFSQPSRIMLKFWDFLVAAFVNSETRPSLSCAEKSLVISALEASRLRGETPDLQILNSVCKWLTANGKSLGDVNGNWSKLYGRICADLTTM
uniref:Defective in cullin neddylation protein n=1 Tax=Gongylonema pulchrum TaxID=637853 RepID=A0A183D6B6_9BILA